MAHLEELYPEGAQLKLRPRGDLLQRAPALQPVFAELAVHQTQGQPAPEDRDVQLAQQVRQGAHVVLVTVREQDAQHLLSVLHDVGEIREHQVDAQHLLVREHQPGVDDDERVTVFDDRHVLADGPQATKGDDSQCGGCHVRLPILCRIDLSRRRG